MMIKDYKPFRRLQHPYGRNAFKVCESEIMAVRDLFVERYVDCTFYGQIVLKWWR